MSTPDVNVHMLNMESLKRYRYLDDKYGNKCVILRNFQESFFAMSRMVSFPWTVSKCDLKSVAYMQWHMLSRCRKLTLCKKIMRK